MSMRKRYWLPSVVLSVLVSLAVSSASAITPPLTTTQANLPGMVTATPAPYTPQVHFAGDAIANDKNNATAIVDAPGTKPVVVAGGSFTQVKAVSSTALVARNNGYAFDPTTGALTGFNPDLNGEVWAVLPSASQTEIYLCGDFTTAQGVARRGIAKFVMSTGLLDTNFNANLDGSCSDVVFVNNRLIVMGSFMHAGSASREAIAYIHQLDGTTDSGAGYFASTVFAGNTGGTTSIHKGLANPQGTALLVLGDYSTIDGQGREQAAMLMMGASSATLAAWNNAWFVKACSHDYAYGRAIAWSPDGSTFYLGFTGGPHHSTFCDSVASFPYKPTDSTGRINWIMSTDGDTVLSLVDTTYALYVGGHFRYFSVTGPVWPPVPLLAGQWCDINNHYLGREGAINPKTGTPYAFNEGYNCPTPNAVYRPGIAALDPNTGAILSWDPQRDREEGAYGLYTSNGSDGSPAGLYVASDGRTAGCANPGGVNHDDCNGEPLTVVGGLAFFPLAVTSKVKAIKS